MNPKHLTSALACVLLAACSRSSSSQSSDASQGADHDMPPPAQIAEISPDRAKSAGIETADSGPADIRQTLMLYGSIKANGERQQDIRARYPGVVREVSKRTGDTVTKGETLLSVESNDSLEPYSIRAPFSGTVLDRRVNPGDSVDGTMTALVVADLSTVWADFAVFPRDLAAVNVGLPVLVRGGEGQATTTSQIAYVAPGSSGDTQSVLVRAIVDNKNKRWIAGQFVTGDVVVDQKQVAISVKPSALQRMGADTVVFVQTDRGFEPRKVEIGDRDDQAAEIKAGLSAGVRYAVKNSYLIKAELSKGVGEDD